MTMTRRVRPYLAVAAGILLVHAAVGAADKVRIIQTNSAGDNVHIIDPATNKVVGVISGIEVEPRGGGRARRQPHLRQQRSRQHARLRGRQDAQGDQAKSR